uniref:Nidogen 1b n=1 Tax=Salarias fasciatus TaxID=181472 RepID=A0A672GWZ2_SALFA
GPEGPGGLRAAWGLLAPLLWGSCNPLLLPSGALLGQVVSLTGSLSRWINTNGFVAVAKPPPEGEYLGKMPSGFKMIAALMGDLDNSDGEGTVHFRQDSSPGVLRRAAEHIRKAFPRDEGVEPRGVLVVTWENMAARGATCRLCFQRNTFQLVVASMASSCSAILLYPRDGLQFLSTPAGQDSKLLEAGFNEGLVSGWFRNKQGTYFRTTTDEETSLRELTEKTNSAKNGVWVYEIGASPFFIGITPGMVADSEDEVETEPPVTVLPRQTAGPQEVDSSTPEPLRETTKAAPENKKQFFSAGSRNHVNEAFMLLWLFFTVFAYNLETCAHNRQKCSAFADCRDYSDGYCCHCRPGYYGNGKECVAEGKPQRMNGKVNGRVFVGNSRSPVELRNNDLHSYVVANDGRAYVAISSIPDGVGPSLQPLSSLGGVMGWAFALEQPGYHNGFSLIGGVFSRQAEVTFQPGNERLTIKQQFEGIDEHDHLVVNTELEGRLPHVALGSSVQIHPYKEIYLYVITSSSNREYTVTTPEGSVQNRSFQWRQTITFQGCPHEDASRAAPSTQQLSVDQIFVMFDDGNHLIRYAMSNKIGVPEQNPCFTGHHGCDISAVCRPGDGQQFSCECTAGFTGDGRQCQEREKTLCERRRESAQAAASSGDGLFSLFRPRPAVGRYTPQCDEHGAFVPLQCHAGAGQCWCVDADGEEIPDTRSGPGGAPLCIDRSVAPAPVGPTPRPDVRPVAPGANLLFAQSGKIEGVPLNGRGMETGDAKPVLHVPDQVVIAVAYDCVDKMVYWTDISRPSISRARLTGGDVVTLVSEELQSPEGIAIDHVARLMFWTDSMRDTVEVSKLDGSQRRVLFDTDLVNPRPIVTDPAYGIYWADWNRDGPKIEMSNMDGTDRSILVQDELGLPNGLTFDPNSQELCWADAGTRKVECMDPHRRLRRVVVEGIQYPFAVVSFGGSLYYTDWRRDAVVAVDRRSGSETEEFLPHKRSRLYGITTTTTQCPQAYNYCSDNGGCSHLCLPRPGGFSCRCPDATDPRCVEGRP